jgi:hypothetical protein
MGDVVVGKLFPDENRQRASRVFLTDGSLMVP